jgi:hypothetical protein
MPPLGFFFTPCAHRRSGRRRRKGKKAQTYRKNTKSDSGFKIEDMKVQGLKEGEQI